MTLYLVGLGLDKRDITLKGLEALHRCEKIYLDTYTGLLTFSIRDLEILIDKKIISAYRDMVEKNPETTILADAKDKDVAFCVAGDPLSATTHYDLILRADSMGIRTEVINGISIMTTIGLVGLQLYKYGKTTSIVFPEKEWMPQTPYNTIKQNRKDGLHTLLLLDIKVKEQSKQNIRDGKEIFEKARFMTVNKGIKYLLDVEDKTKELVFTKTTRCIGCARLGTNDYMIRYGTAKELSKIDFGAPLHCLIVPGDLHFIEEEILKRWTL